MKPTQCFPRILVFILITHGAVASGFSLLNPLSSNGVEITVRRDPNVKCQQNTVECTNCNQGIMCRPENGELIQIAEITCLADSKTPYCNPNRLCVGTPPTGCGWNQFLCPDVDGTYPDPVDCTRYHLCANGVAITNECPLNNVYDHQLGGCKLQRFATDCVNFNCLNGDGSLVVYPRDNRIWGRCINGKAFILGRCKSYERFDISRKQCIRECRSTGNQPTDPFECQKYVFCAEVARNVYRNFTLLCACNEGFSLEDNRCTTNAPCLADLKNLCGEDDDEAISSQEIYVLGNDSDGDVNGANNAAVGNSGNEIKPFLVSNSGNGNSMAGVSNGNDDIDGNLVNGNGNDINTNSGNVQQNQVGIQAQVVEDSGDEDDGNSGSDENDGPSVGNAESLSERAKRSETGAAVAKEEFPDLTPYLDEPEARNFFDFIYQWIIRLIFQ